MTGTTGKVLVLFIIPLILYVGLLPVMPLMEPDESRYSLIPRSMNKSGDYITPRLKEALYLEKPPLAYWAAALSFKIFGETEFSSRLFAALCAWGCILLVFSMGTYFRDGPAGLYGAAVLTTSLYHFAVGRINILDMPVAFFLSLAIWSGYRNFAGTDKKGWLYLFYAMSALAFLTKGLIGIVFPAAIIIVWLVCVKRWREVWRLLSPLGIIIFLVLTLPWLVLIQQAHGDFLRFFFIQEHFQRYTSDIHQHGEPFYYYVPVLILGTLPWCAFLFQALPGRGAAGQEELFFKWEERVFLLVWIGFIILFFSLSSSKLIPYVAAVFLPLALFQGRIFSRYEARPRVDKVFAWVKLPVLIQSLVFILALILLPHLGKGRSAAIGWPWIVIPILAQALLVFLPLYVRRKTGANWFVTIYGLTALFLGATLFPVTQYIAPRKSAWSVAQAVARHVPAHQALYQYGVSLYGIDFYTGRRTPLVDDLGEVGYGSEFLPPAERARYFLHSPEFFLLCKTEPAIYCATKGRERVERLRKEVSRLTILWDNNYYYLLRLEK